MAKTVIMDHPLIQHKIGIIRKKETGTKDFRQLISEIAMLITYEATRNLELVDEEIDTPICKTTVKRLGGKKLAIVPILRAGLGMVDGMLAMIPSAKVGHIGLYRRHCLTSITVSYLRIVTREKYLLWILCLQQVVQL